MLCAGCTWHVLTFTWLLPCATAVFLSCLKELCTVPILKKGFALATFRIIFYANIQHCPFPVIALLCSNFHYCSGTVQYSAGNYFCEEHLNEGEYSCSCCCSIEPHGNVWEFPLWFTHYKPPLSSGL